MPRTVSASQPPPSHGRLPVRCPHSASGARPHGPKAPRPHGPTAPRPHAPTAPRPHGRSLLTCAIPGLPPVPWSQRPCRITPANLSLTSPHSSTLPLTPPQPLYLPLPHPPTYLPPAGTERRPGGRQRTTFRPGQRAAEEGQSGIKAAVDVHQKCDHHVRQAVEQASGYEPGGAPERFTSRVRSHG